jgi:plasmid stabilization system protein ParE
VTSEPSSPRVVWSDQALRDLASIWAYVALDDLTAADSWLQKLVAAAEQASWLPRAGRIVPEMQGDLVREVLCGSYRVAYRIREDGITIATVFEGHREFPRNALP